MLTKIEKTCWINKWQTQHQKVLCIHECLKLELCCGTICSQTPTFIIHAASLYYLIHITNVCSFMEILPIHCGAGSVKVNYYRSMRKIWGLVKPQKVNKLQMRLSYRRIYFNTVCNMKNTNNLTQINFYKQKSFSGYTLSGLCSSSVLASWVTNALDRCFASLF